MGKIRSDLFIYTMITVGLSIIAIAVAIGGAL